MSEKPDFYSLDQLNLGFSQVFGPLYIKHGKVQLLNVCSKKLCPVIPTSCFQIPMHGTLHGVAVSTLSFHSEDLGWIS
jgi:hypothetical protein